MKIVAAQEMARLEKLAYAEGASEEAFMEAAGKSVADRACGFIAERHLKPPIGLLCGRGNNAGDAYVAGRYLVEGGFPVRAFALSAEEHCGELCRKQLTKFLEVGGIIHWVQSSQDLKFEQVSMLIDGIFGTGFHGSATGMEEEAILKANASGLPILSIDIPSGMDGTTGQVGSVAIHAAETVFLGLPKIGCFLDEAWNFTGKVSVRGFGLDDKFIAIAEASAELLQEAEIKAIMPKIVRTRHKYQAGYVVGIGGSVAMPGAPLLSSLAALRSGAGIVRLMHPAGTESSMAASAPEIIKQPYKDLSTLVTAIEKAKAVFVGPGLGNAKETKELLKAFLPRLDKPCVLDADALGFLAENPLSLSEQTVLTPHHGEMQKLLGLSHSLPIRALLQHTQDYVNMARVTVILKGAPTFILHPGKLPQISPWGDPGMATAGSGDVLTGIVAAFLAQGKSPVEAAQLALYFHGKAGESAALRKSSYAMIATDIIQALPDIFKAL